jgi:hypothetical protein
MPIYKTALRMAHDASWPQRKKWSTTFLINTSAASVAAASMVGAWIAYLNAAARSIVFAYEAYATDLNPDTEDFAVQPIPLANQRGLIVTGNEERYLAKACINQRLNVLSSRPSFKFWRPGLVEADVINGVDVSPTLLTAISTAFSAMIEDFEGSLVDPDGQVISTPGKQTLTTREFGRYAGNELPLPPPVG